MKKLFSFLFLSLASLISVACSGSDDNDKPAPESVTIECTPSEVSVPAVGGEYTVSVTSSRSEWNAYVEDADWIKVRNENTATKSGSIKLTISKNEGESKRTAVLNIVSGNGHKTVTISQDAALQLSATSFFSNSIGQDFTVTITASSDWTAKSDASWITATKADAKTLKITVAPNNDKADREGKVTVTSGQEEAVINVKQNSVDDRDITCPLDGYHLVWHDEFSEGTSLDTKNWRHEVQRDHWVNNELQNYVNEKSPAGQRVTEIVDGKLHINCFKEGGKIYSGRVYGNSSKGWTYAYVEAKIKLPTGKGTWPAFWMMPVNFKSWPHDGEIDIMEEVGADKDQVSSSLHADGHVHSNNTQVTKATYCKGAEGEFHLYAMEWTADYFQFYVDGKKTLYYKNPGTGVRDWPYDAPFYVILNLAWGGDWGGYKGVDESKLPLTMEVDYVRVFQK